MSNEYSSEQNLILMAWHVIIFELYAEMQKLLQGDARTHKQKFLFIFPNSFSLEIEKWKWSDCEVTFETVDSETKKNVACVEFPALLTNELIKLTHCYIQNNSKRPDYYSGYNSSWTRRTTAERAWDILS